MKKIILLSLFLIGCTQKFSKQDVMNGKVETCNDLINLFIPPQLEKRCIHEEETNRILIEVKNPYNGAIAVYDTKTGDMINK